MIDKVRSQLERMYRRLLRAMPTGLRVRVVYARRHHRWPNLARPRSFNEKVVWHKLYARDLRLPDYVDKVKAKLIVTEKLGMGAIIPTLAVYDSVEEMNFGLPPLSQPPYVIKASHGSGMNVFVKGSLPNLVELKSQLAGWLRCDFSAVNDEWVYSKVRRRILVEPFLSVSEGGLEDYKFHVFGGKVFAIEHISGRFSGAARSNFYNEEWEPLNVEWGFPRGDYSKSPPSCFGQLREAAEILGREFSYVRVDLYIVNQAVKFGEFTFYPAGGYDPFVPKEWDWTFGRQWLRVGS